MAIYDNLVRDLETFPHRVVLKLFQESRFNELDLTEFSQVHVIEDVKPEALLDDLNLADVLWLIEWLQELYERFCELFLFLFDGAKLVLYPEEVFLRELVGFRIY